jgi:hypothetical protein
VKVQVQVKAERVVLEKIRLEKSRDSGRIRTRTEDLIGDSGNSHEPYYWPSVVNFVVECTVF